MAWLKCAVSPGTFSHERGVSIITADNRKVSGFFPIQRVNEKEQLLEVEIIRTEKDRCLIRVPGFPSGGYGFIAATSAIWVPKDLIVL